jgi:hypothetical protein
MANTYRVVDLRTNIIAPTETTVTTARSPEDAVRQVLGLEVVRSGHRKDLVARVYWQPVGQPVTMVRLYGRVAGETGSSRPSSTLD